jgi:hypothetical protein
MPDEKRCPCGALYWAKSLAHVHVGFPDRIVELYGQDCPELPRQRHLADLAFAKRSSSSILNRASLSGRVPAKEARKVLLGV